jgi:hypothetical protein
MNENELDETASLVAAGDFYNPRPATRTDLREILQAAFEGRRPSSSSA